MKYRFNLTISIIGSALLSSLSAEVLETWTFSEADGTAIDATYSDQGNVLCPQTRPTLMVKDERLEFSSDGETDGVFLINTLPKQMEQPLMDRRGVQHMGLDPLLVEMASIPVNVVLDDVGYLLAIRLQLHDNQAGRHFSYKLMDYDLLVDWLEQISEVSPGTEYPMLLASRVYTATSDHRQLRQILGFIERRFGEDPQLHWRRLAEASVIAKHRLGDLELALRMAGKLAQQPASIDLPQWARDFEFLLLAELNELESAIIIIEALLQTEAVNDPDERLFLQEKLLDFRQKLFDSQQLHTN